MNWNQQKLKKVEFPQELEYRSSIKTLNNLFLRTFQCCKICHEYREGIEFFHTQLTPHEKLLTQQQLQISNPWPHWFKLLKNSMWHLSNGRHQLKGRKSFLKYSARAGLAQSLFEGLVLLGVKPIRLQVNLCFHHSFFLLSDMNDWCPSHFDEQLLNT